MEKISVAIINYNGKKTIIRTIKSIYEMENVDASIHILDDCSTDGSLEMVQKEFPEILIAKQPKNIAKLNVLRNKAINSVNTRYLLLTDNDIDFDCRCLDELLKVMKLDENIATCTPRLMQLDQPDKIYSTATKVHFIGAAIKDRDDEVLEKGEQLPSLNSGGGILLIDRDKAVKVGNFDEDFRMGWGDDGEFYQRLMRAGYNCLYVPSAFAYHEDKPFSTTRKYRATGQIYNRWLFILTHYSVPLIIFLIPAFIIYDLLQLVFMTIKKIPLLYFIGSFEVLKNLPLILRKRKIIQRLKVVSDKEILFSGMIYISPSLLNNSILKAFNDLLTIFYHMYWKILKLIIP